MDVAKVLISLPDDVLESLDARAAELRATRSGLLRELVEREIETASGARASKIQKLLARPVRRGGTGTQAVREDRRSR